MQRVDRVFLDNHGLSGGTRHGVANEMSSRPEYSDGPLHIDVVPAGGPRLGGGRYGQGMLLTTSKSKKSLSSGP